MNPWLQRFRPSHHRVRRHLEHVVHASRRHRFLYVANPKVGCSSIIWTLRRFESGDPNAVPDRVGDIHDRAGSPLLRFSDLDAPDALEGPGLLRFTFVRNPFDRLMSCYLQKIVRETPERATLLELLDRPPRDTGRIDFDEFVGAVAEQPPEAMDPHWRIQSRQTLQDLIDYDFIGRFEHFDRDLAELGRRISPGFDAFIHAERRQATGAKPTERISPATAATIRRVYAEDFERFSYPEEVPGS